MHLSTSGAAGKDSRLVAGCWCCSQERCRRAANGLMVVLNIKRGDKSLFLFETTCPSPVDEVTRQVVLVHNLRLRIQRLCGQCEVRSFLSSSVAGDPGLGVPFGASTLV